MNTVRLLLPLTLLFGLVSACAFLKPTASESSPDNAAWQLIVFKPGWNELQLGYAAAPAQTTLFALDTGDPLFVVSLSQIAAYDWEQQTITLTSEASTALAQALADAGGATADVQALTDFYASLGWGSAVSRALYTRAFVVLVEGEPVYGGIFLDAVSQMAIDYPVARVSRVGDQLVLALLPIHIPFAEVDPVGGSGVLGTVQVPDVAAADIAQLEQNDGFFSQWMQDVALSESAVQFRLIIRDESIHTILAEADKLAD